MKQIVAFVCISLFLLTSCTNYKVLRKTVTNAPQAIELVNKTENHVFLIEVQIKGKIDGNAIISMSGYGKAEIKGDVDWSYSGDWYSNEAIIEYEPVNATTGELVIKYKFHEL